MYCQYCGKKLEENSNSCVNCGAGSKIDKGTAVVKGSKGRGIAAMVLGIVAVFFAFIILVTSPENTYFTYYTGIGQKISYAFGQVFFQVILAIIGISLAGTERAKSKNGFNTAGLWLAISTFILAIITYIIILFI